MLKATSEILVFVCLFVYVCGRGGRLSLAELVWEVYPSSVIPKRERKMFNRGVVVMGDSILTVYSVIFLELSVA